MVRETSAATVRGIAIAAAVVAIAIAGLAGCGGGDDDSPDTTAAGTGSEQTGTEGSGEGSGAGAGNITTFGEEASTADRDAAGTAVQEFLRARADGDWAQACSLMSASTQETLAAFGGEPTKSVPCAKLLERVASQISAKLLAAGEQTEVTAVRIEGDRGFVLYRDASGSESAFAVVREGSVWKAGAINGTPLP
jgi:hypothetical protein